MSDRYWDDTILSARDDEDDELQEFLADDDGVLAQLNDVEPVFDSEAERTRQVLQGDEDSGVSS